MRNVPISPLAAIAAETEESAALIWGTTTDCSEYDLASLGGPLGAGEKLLAAYGLSSHDGEVRWLRLVQRKDKPMLEVASPRIRRVRIDPQLARLISSRLTEDLLRNAFESSSEDLPLHAPWIHYSADGKSCASFSVFDGNERAGQWSQVMDALFDGSSSREADAWFWLDQFEQRPATIPTSLAGMTREHAVVGAASTWTHPGVEPMSILSHHAKARYLGDGVEIIGELANNMDTREYTDVIATFQDVNGAILGTDEALVEFSKLPSGARSPFSASTELKNVASYTLRIVPGKSVRLRPPSIRITHQEARSEDDELIVHGSVHNDGKNDEEFVEVHVNLYDKAGALLDSDSAYVHEPLKAGASGPFEVSVDLPPGYHHHEVIVNPEYRKLRE